MATQNINVNQDFSFIKCVHWLDENFEKVFLVIGLLSIILFISAQTIHRYFLAELTDSAGAMVWSEEATRYIFIWISYLALPVAIKNRSSIRIDILYDALPKRWQQITWIIADFCFLMFTLFICYTGWGQIERLMMYPQHSVAMDINFIIPYTILPFGFGLMALRLFQDMYKQIKVCGTFDSILGIVLSFLVWLPLYPVLWAMYLGFPETPPFLYDYISPLPVIFSYFVVLALLGVPIAISLALAALATIITSDTLPIEYISQVTFASIDSFPIVSIPFFIAAGAYMGAGGLSTRLLNFTGEMLGGLHGGIALTAVGTSMFFGAISGSGPATVAAIGAITVPTMIKMGYDKYFCGALIASAGATGVMIPPSNPFIVYGVTTQVSVGDLFIGGIVPGLLIGFVLMAYTYLYSRKRGWRGEIKERNMASFFKAFWDAKFALLVPVIVLGGIYGGLMTPTEAAAIAALYGLIVGALVYKELTVEKIINCCVESAQTSATIIVLIAMATLFGNIMTLENVPTMITKALLSISENKYVLLLLINILLLFVGIFMETLAAILILAPILLPVAVSIGVSPLHFGIIMVVNLAIGFVTPPVGVNLFVASGITKSKITELSVYAFPMIGLMLLILLLITYVPSVTLFLL